MPFSRPTKPYSLRTAARSQAQQHICFLGDKVSTTLPPLPAEEFEFFRKFLHRKHQIEILPEQKFDLEISLRKRLARRRIHRWVDYISILDQDKGGEESRAVHQELLRQSAPSYTQQPHYLHALQHEVLPKHQGTAMTLWLSGNALPVEAYAIAILIEEWNHHQPQQVSYQIITSGHETNKDQQPPSGMFPQKLLNHYVPPSVLAKYSVRARGSHTGNYKMDPLLTQHIQFCWHQDPDLLNTPNSLFDCILLKKKEVEIGSRLLTRVNRLLHANGVLLLSEMPALRTLEAHFKLHKPYVCIKKSCTSMSI